MLAWIIRRGVIISVCIVAVCLLGLVSLFRVPIQMTPNIEQSVVSVRTIWPGANPQDIEAEIVVEQERYLRRLRGLVKMTSESKSGSATIDLEFDLSTSSSEALLRTNNALSQVASYPENVDPPSLVTSSSDQDPFIFYNLIAVEPEKYQPTAANLSHLLDRYVRDRLERIEGVSQVIIFVNVDRQVHINVDPEKLASVGISFSQFRTAVRSRNRDISGGNIESGKRRYQVRTIGRFSSLEDIAGTVIAQRNGDAVLLRDVADVEFSSQTQASRGYINGQPSFPFGIVRTPGSNVIEIYESVSAEIAQINKKILKSRGLEIIQYSNDVRYVKSAIKVVQINLLIGAFLASIVLFLFLKNLRPTFIGAIGLPICALGAILGLAITGRTINVISLAGIAFAIGMTLDNSIVVLENIFRHRKLGKSTFDAALDGVSEVWPAVLASTLTTIAVFTPVILIQGEVGQLYSDIAIAISAAVAMSMLVAITVIPVLSANLLGKTSSVVEPSRFGVNLFDSTALGFKRLVTSLVTWLLVSAKRQIFLVAVVLMGTVGLAMQLSPGAEYLPEGEEKKIFAFMLSPPGYNMEEIDRASQHIEAMLVEQIDADGSDYAQGKTQIPPMSYMLRVANIGSMLSISEPISDDPAHAESLKQVLSKELNAVPGMIGFANRGSLFSGNAGGSRNIELNVFGPDLTSIYAAAMQSFLALKAAFPDAQIRPVPGLSLAQPSIEIEPNWQRLAENNITATELGALVWAMADGAYLDEYFMGDEKVDIYTYPSGDLVETSGDLESLPIYTSQGGVMSLGALADISSTVTASSIRRVDGRRAITLNLVPSRDIALEDAADKIENEVIPSIQAGDQFDSRVQIQLGGASNKLAAARDALDGNLLLAIALSYLLMVVIFSHWGYPLVILLNIPLGICGGIVGLWFVKNVVGANVNLDMLTMLGMIVLIGTVVNNPILLLEQTRKLIAQGESVAKAISGSVEIRLRPIMMSMLTTIVGLSPVVFSSGAGTELYRGLGTVVMFGLLFSTVLTLTFMPALLALLFNKGYFSKR